MRIFIFIGAKACFNCILKRFVILHYIAREGGKWYTNIHEKKYPKYQKVWDPNIPKIEWDRVYITGFKFSCKQTNDILNTYISA